MNETNVWPANNEILRVDNIHKAFDGIPVLQEISFTLKEKEILGIIGPSGGGKTTLLKCLDFLEIIDSGEIDYYEHFKITKEKDGNILIKTNSAYEEISGEDAFNNLRKEIGFVFQGFNLWEERSVFYNLTLAPRVVLGKNFKELEDETIELSRQFGLESKLHSKVWELSGGQRQRVAIMRALMMKPKIMLLDEITSALDPVLTVEVMQAIKQLREKGLSMIIVTHHIEFASSLCDRIMFLSQGKIIQLDTPEVLRASPSTEEVRKFLEILQTAR
jgi:ABC-type polar amino acid transport system ATPase subunit